MWTAPCAEEVARFAATFNRPQGRPHLVKDLYNSTVESQVGSHVGVCEIAFSYSPFGFLLLSCFVFAISKQHSSVQLDGVRAQAIGFLLTDVLKHDSASSHDSHEELHRTRWNPF